MAPGTLGSPLDMISKVLSKFDGIRSTLGIFFIERKTVSSHPSKTNKAGLLTPRESIYLAIGPVLSIPFGISITSNSFNWSCLKTWKESSYNTLWCLIGCSIGDFGTIAAFQFVFTESGWTPMMIMALAMFNGIMTSIALETVILSAQMALKEAFRVAIGMSLISMISMEAAMNVVDLVLTGGAKLTWWVILPMLVAGFLTPWPYNYWRLKKYGVACH